MKKQVKKLALAKETLGKLDDWLLVEAAGGCNTHSCEASICLYVECTMTC